PLAVIHGYANRLDKITQTGEPIRDTVREIGRGIQATIHRVSEIVKGLRNFARDGSTDPMTPVGIADLINELVTLCEERLKANGIKLIVEVFEQGLTVNGRKVELAQVLLNLLNNASDAAVETEGEKW